MSNKIIELSTFTDVGDCKREDIDQLISALVHMGYNVWMKDNYVCFDVGNDDVIRDKSES